VIRPAYPEDVPAILALVRDLAEYERALHHVEATVEQLDDALFGPDPQAYCLVAEHEVAEHEVAEHLVAEHEVAEHEVAEQEGTVAGFAIWFLSFSTWLGRHGIYLEDLYVRPELRGLGYGRALLQELARVCVERGYGRLEWAVLDWNEPALGFYRSLGAETQEDWTVHRVRGDALRRLAAGNR
jgi:GNAT superfamily N-acetyltransferase